MVTKLKFFFIAVLLCSPLKEAVAADKILVERYENWNHPVLVIFKQYGVSLYKISYSRDGKYPTFYATFKYSPDPRAPDADNFHKIYFDILKANSYFPYALIDEEDGIRINVGWKSKEKRTIFVDIGNVSSNSTCSDKPTKN